MSITQEQFDALKPGDRVLVGPAKDEAEFIGHLRGRAWGPPDGELVGQGYGPAAIAAIIPPAPQPVAYINLDADGCSVTFESRGIADQHAYGDRTHVITIYSDGSTTTEAVS